MSKIERKIKNFLAAVGIAAGSFTPDASMFQKDINQAALDAMRNDKAGSPTLVVDNPYNIQLSPDQQYAPEQYQNLGTFVELPSVRNLTSQEQQGIHALLAERFQHQDIPQEGRFLVPFTLDLSTQTIEGFPPISQNSDLARHFEQTRNLAEDVSSFGGESTLLLAVEKGSNGDITQAALFLQPTNDFQFGEVSFSQDYQSFIVAQEDGTPVWFQTNDLPQGASLDLITSPFDIQTIAEHARLNGYDIDATAYQGGFVVVARDRQGKVVRVFTKEGALTFQRTYLTHTGGDAVNIRDIPSTSGNRVGSFTPQSEPLPTVTPQQFQELGVQVPDPSRLTITDTSVAYNDGRYEWTPVLMDDGQIRWIANLPQIHTQVILEGVTITQERTHGIHYEVDPTMIARQLETRELETITSTLQRSYAEYNSDLIYVTSGIEVMVNGIPWQFVTNVPGMRMDARTTNVPLLLDVLETLGQTRPDRPNVTNVVVAVLYVPEFQYAYGLDQISQGINDTKFNMTRFLGTTQIDVSEMSQRHIEYWGPYFNDDFSWDIQSMTLIQIFNGGLFGPHRYVDPIYGMERRLRERYAPGVEEFWEHPSSVAVVTALGVVRENQ